jgi:SAM-dependent methyltransferase
MKSRSFFDTYPGEYELLTNEKARIPKHALEITALISKCHPSRVLDAGCGTGLTAALFAKQGIETVGIDNSSSMLSIATAKYGAKRLPLSFKRASFDRLPVKFKAGFDLVTCLGNSLSGVESVSGLKATARNFAAVLLPGGYLVLQLLNVASLAQGEIYPVRATRSGSRFYLRYLIRTGKLVSLHVIRVDSSASAPSFEPFIHESHPLDYHLVSRELKTAGFETIRMYGDLQLQTKFTKTGRDLVMLARKKR